MKHRDNNIKDYYKAQSQFFEIDTEYTIIQVIFKEYSVMMFNLINNIVSGSGCYLKISFSVELVFFLGK